MAALRPGDGVTEDTLITPSANLYDGLLVEAAGICRRVNLPSSPLLHTYIPSLRFSVIDSC
jgi:hypothetical protein